MCRAGCLRTRWYHRSCWTRARAATAARHGSPRTTPSPPSATLPAPPLAGSDARWLRCPGSHSLLLDLDLSTSGIDEMSPCFLQCHKPRSRVAVEARASPSQPRPTARSLPPPDRYSAFVPFSSASFFFSFSSSLASNSSAFLSLWASSGENILRSVLNFSLSARSFCSACFSRSASVCGSSGPSQN